MQTPEEDDQDADGSDTEDSESESEDQQTDQEDALAFKKQRFVWIMTDKGKTVTQPIELGMTMDDLVQVTNGVPLGQWIADEQEDHFREGSTFLTPINLDHLSLLQTKESSGETIWNYLKMGMLAR